MVILHHPFGGILNKINPLIVESKGLKKMILHLLLGKGRTVIFMSVISANNINIVTGR